MPAESSKSEVDKPPRQATAGCIGALNSVATPSKKRKKKKEKATQSAATRGVKCGEKASEAVTQKTCPGKLQN